MSQATSPAEIKAIVKGFILENFLPGEDPDQLTDTTPLVSGAILDSLATVKLIAFLEQRFNIEFAPHELSGEYLETLNIIADTVESKRTQ